MQSQEAAEFSKEHVPLDICLKIDKVVKDVWEEVKMIPVEDLCKEVSDWVVYQGNMVGRALVDNYLLMMYWVFMQLVQHSSISMESKREGDEEPARAWKEHNGECDMMH